MIATIACHFANAKHHFSICYHNQTNSNISYNNDGISKKWLHRGELVGSGVLNSRQSKCFAGIEDETVFSFDYITFYINGKWIGVVNTGFKKPYVVTQDAVSTSSKDGKLPHAIISGKDIYTLNIHIVNKDGGVILSGDSNPKMIASYITPRVFK